MEFADVVRKRRMVRHFKPDPIPEDSLDRIIDAARRAPSAGNTQGQSLVVITDPEMRKTIGEICGEREYAGRFKHNWISEAPVQVIACTSEKAYRDRYSEPDKLQDDGSVIEWPVPYWHIDVGCTVMALLYAVVNEGLAAGFTGTQRFQELKDVLGIPDEVTPVGIIPIGYPDQDVKSPSLKRGRKSLDEFAHRERW
ncbi:MAG: nitroreductase family protein [Sphaerobacteraceae bacterium]|nr:MAG: nitroreductase family protein [Sphaerobacteraceae bacterium]